MAAPFVLSARLQFSPQTNISQVIQSVRAQLAGVTVPISVQIAGGATQGQLTTLQGKLTTIRTELNAINQAAGGAAVGMQKMAQAITRGGGMQQVSRGAKEASRSVRQVGIEARAAGSEMAYFGHQSALAVRRFLAFSIPAMAVVSLVVGIKRGVSAAVQFERELVKVSQITGKTFTELRQLQGIISDLAITWGVSSAELVETSRILAQTGMSAKDVGIALDALAKSDLAPTFENMNKTAEGFIATMRQFRQPVENVNVVLSEMNAISKNFAVESGDLISAIRRTGGAFSAAGGDVRELEALFTSVRSTTRESADSIATGFRTIFTRMQRPRTLEMLKQFNIELQEGTKFVGPYEAVRRLHAELSKLDPRDVRFAQIIEVLGGFRQVSKVIPLVQQFTVAQKAYAVALAGSTSLEEDAIKAKKTLAQQVKMIREEWVLFFREFTASKTFQAMAKSALSFARALGKVAQSIGPVIAPLMALMAFKGIGGLTRFAGGFFTGMHMVGGARRAGTGMAAVMTGRAGAGAAAASTPTAIANTVPALAQNTTAVVQLTRAVWALRALLGRQMMMIPGMGAYRIGMTRGGIATARSRLILPGSPGYQMQAGGPVRGHGAVPVIAHEGEYVVSKKAVDRYGAATFAAFNKRSVSQRQAGGPVGAVRPSGFMGGGGLMASWMISGMILATMQDLDSGFARLIITLNKVITTLFAFQIGMQALSALSGLRGRTAGLLRPSSWSGRKEYGWWNLRQSVGSRYRGQIPGIDKPIMYRHGPLLAGGLRTRGMAAGRGIEALTGFTGTQAAALGGGAGLFMGGHLLSSYAGRRAGKAKTADELRRLETMRTGGAALKGAGAGLAVGAMIAGPIGAAVGAAVGGLVGALSANTKELRQLNRSAKFEEAAEKFGDAVKNLLEKGTGGFGYIGQQLKQQLDQLNRAYADLDDKQIKAFRDQIRAQIPALYDLRTKIIENVSSLERFKKYGGGLGENIIDSIVEATRQSADAVESEIKKDLKLARDAELNRQKRLEATKAIYETTQALYYFNATLRESAARLNASFNAIGRVLEYAGGRVGVPTYTGLPGFGEFSLAAEGLVRDMPQFGKALDQLFVGLAGEEGRTMAKHLEQGARLIADLPQALREATADYTTGSDAIITYLQDRLKPEVYGQKNLDLIFARLSELLQSRGKGEAEGLRRIRESPERFTEELSQYLKPMYEAADELSGAVLEVTSKIRDAVEQRVDLELQILNETKNLQRKRLEGEQLLYQATSSAIGRPGAFPFERQAHHIRRRRELQVQGILPARQAFDPVAIAAKYKELKRESDSLIEAFRSMKYSGEESAEMWKRFGDIGRDATRLHTALRDLASSSEELSALQGELGRLQEERERKFTLLADYAFGDRSTQISILGDVASTILAGQAGTVGGMWPQQKQGVQRMAQMFEDVALPMFGKSAQGGWRKGKELIRDVIMNDIIRTWGPVHGKQWAAGMAEGVSPGAEEDRIINELRNVVGRQERAQFEWIATLRSWLGELNNTLTTIHEQFARTLGQAFAQVLGAQAGGKRTFLERKLGGLQKAQKAGVGAEGLVMDLFKLMGLDVSEGGAHRKDVQSSIDFLGEVTAREGDFKGLRAIGTMKEFFETGGESLSQTFLSALAKDLEGIKQHLTAGATTRDIMERTRETWKKHPESPFTDLYTSAPDVFEELMQEIHTRISSAMYHTMTPKHPFESWGLKPERLMEAGDVDRKMDLYNVWEKGIKILDQMYEDRAKELADALFEPDLEKWTALNAIVILEASMGQITSQLDLLGTAAKGVEFEGLDTQVKYLIVELERLKETIKSLNDYTGGLFPHSRPVSEALPRAAGGSIFKKIGTDTLPAMLTPGEFIVNQKATKKYLPILEQINAQRFQGGGLVDDKPRHPREIDPSVPGFRGGRFGTIRGTGTVAFGGVEVLTPEMLARIAYQRYLWFARRGNVAGKRIREGPRQGHHERGLLAPTPGTGRRVEFGPSRGRGNRFRIYTDALRRTGDPIKAYQEVFGEVWDAAEAVRTAWEEDRFHPFGGEKLAEDITKKYGVDPKNLKGLRPQGGRRLFHGRNLTPQQKAYNKLISAPTKYRSHEFTPREIKIISGPISYPAMVKNLLPPKFWNQWMNLRRALAGESREPIEPREIEADEPRKLEAGPSIDLKIREEESILDFIRGGRDLPPDEAPKYKVQPKDIMGGEARRKETFDPTIGLGIEIDKLGRLDRRIQEVLPPTPHGRVTRAEAGPPPARKPQIGPPVSTAIPRVPSPFYIAEEDKKEKGQIRISGKLYEAGSDAARRAAREAGAARRIAKPRRDSLLLPEYIRNKPPAVRVRLAEKWRSLNRDERDRLNKIMDYDREEDLANVKARHEALQESYRKSGGPRKKPLSREEIRKKTGVDLSQRPGESKTERGERLKREYAANAARRKAEHGKRKAIVARRIELLKREREQKLSPEDAAELQSLREAEQEAKGERKLEDLIRRGGYRKIRLDSDDVPTIETKRISPLKRAGWEFRDGKWRPPAYRIIESPEVTAAREKAEEYLAEEEHRRRKDGGYRYTPSQLKWAEKYGIRLPGIKGYASGGYVSGTDTVPAMLTPGEFVLSKGVVQALQRGGLVQHMQGGGVIEGGFSSEDFQNVVERFNSGIDRLSISFETFSNTASLLEAALQNIPDQFILDTTNFESSISTFNDSIAALTTSISGIPQEIRVEVQAQNLTVGNDEGDINGTQEFSLSDTGRQAFDQFNMATEVFGTHVSSLGGSVDEFGNHVVGMSQAVSAFGEAVSSLNQGMEIEANYTVDINVRGAEAFQDMKVEIQGDLKRAIGEEIDKLKQRFGDLGPEMH